MVALAIGFSPDQAGAIAIIGGADGPTAIFLSSKLAPTNDGCHRSIGLLIYGSCACDSAAADASVHHQEGAPHKDEARPRRVAERENHIPIVGMLLTCFVVPSGLPLLGMLFFGNLLRECGVTTRLAKTASNALTDIVTILLGMTVGASPRRLRSSPTPSDHIYLLPWLYGIHHCFVERCALRQAVQPGASRG